MHSKLWAELFPPDCCDVFHPSLFTFPMSATNLTRCSQRPAGTGVWGQLAGVQPIDASVQSVPGRLLRLRLVDQIELAVAPANHFEFDILRDLGIVPSDRS